MEERIVRFLKEQTCATICCVDEEGKPWCFSCFYAYNFEDGLLFYKSSPSSRHVAILKRNPVVAGTILPDKLNKLQVKGIQFEGEELDPVNPFTKKARAVYYRKYPVALAMRGEINVIRVNHIKMTDNALGFGNRIVWERQNQVAG